MSAIGLTQFLRTYAPDFCWCSSYDLLLMAEQVFPDLDDNCFKVTLSKLKARGVFITKKGAPRYTQRLNTAMSSILSDRLGPPDMYLRVKPAPAEGTVYGRRLSKQLQEYLESRGELI